MKSTLQLFFLSTIFIGILAACNKVDDSFAFFTKLAPGAPFGKSDSVERNIDLNGDGVFDLKLSAFSDWLATCEYHNFGISATPLNGAEIACTYQLDTVTGTNGVFYDRSFNAVSPYHSGDILSTSSTFKDTTAFLFKAATCPYQYFGAIQYFDELLGTVFYLGVKIDNTLAWIAVFPKQSDHSAYSPDFELLVNLSSTGHLESTSALIH